MPRNALVTPLVTRDRNAVGALRNALVTVPLPNPSLPNPVLKTNTWLAWHHVADLGTARDRDDAMRGVR